MIGIYKITNVVNNKCYIGSSVRITERWYDHKTRLNANKHHSIKLQRSFNKYGSNNFVYEIIEECDIDNLLIKEQYYIDLYNTYKNGYNSVPKSGNNLGMKHSDETKEILKEKSIGNKNMLGKNHTDETKKKISEKLKGIPLTDETKEKMKGRIMSEETKKKLSDKLKGRLKGPMSDESKKKMSIAKLGKKQSKETIEHRVKLNTGQKRTDEIKKRMSCSMIGIKKKKKSNNN